jgi:hypothetical protein
VAFDVNKGVEAEAGGCEGFDIDVEGEREREVRGAQIGVLLFDPFRFPFSPSFISRRLFPSRFVFFFVSA